MASTVSRVTISLPTEVLEQLDFVASQLGASRSTLLTSMLGQTLPALVPLAHVVRGSHGLTEGEAKRYSGEFAAQIDLAIKALNAGFGELQGDMFKPKK